MEAFHKLPNSIKGVEVLHFPEAEILKMKGDHNSFGAVGPLDVLYFKDYHRFVLQLNDWKYPLLNRLTIKPLESSGMDRTYSLPSSSGHFQLKINNIPSEDVLKNFESIILKKAEKSPDDKLSRYVEKTVTLKEQISETIKHAVDMVKGKAAALKEGGKQLMGTKQRQNLKSIKTKNFKKSAIASLKKDFFTAGEKETKEFLGLREGNPNMKGLKELKDLESTSETIAPAHYIIKEEIEDAILNSKDIIMTI